VYYYSTMSKDSTVMITLPLGNILLGQAKPRADVDVKHNLTNKLPKGSVIHRKGLRHWLFIRTVK